MTDKGPDWEQYLAESLPKMVASIGECRRCKRSYAYIDNYPITNVCCPDCGDAIQLTPCSKEKPNA